MLLGAKVIDRGTTTTFGESFRISVAVRAKSLFLILRRAVTQRALAELTPSNEYMQNGCCLHGSFAVAVRAKS